MVHLFALGQDSKSTAASDAALHFWCCMLLRPGRPCQPALPDRWPPFLVLKVVQAVAGGLAVSRLDRSMQYASCFTHAFLRAYRNMHISTACIVQHGACIHCGGRKIFMVCRAAHYGGSQLGCVVLQQCHGLVRAQRPEHQKQQQPSDISVYTGTVEGHIPLSHDTAHLPQGFSVGVYVQCTAGWHD